MRRECRHLTDKDIIPQGHSMNKVSFWVAITADGPQAIVPIQGNLNSKQYQKIIKEHLLQPHRDREGYFGIDYFVHDNVALANTQDVRHLITDYGMQKLDIPTYSPDLNCIENLFNELKRRVSVLVQPGASRDQVIEAAMKAFFEIPREYCKALVDSEVNRLTAVIENRGGYTTY